MHFVEQNGEDVMLDLLWALAAIFVVLWILGFATNFMAGGLLHLLLVFAVAAVLIRIVAGRRHSHA